MNTNPVVIIYIHGTLPPRTMLKIPLIKRFFRCPPGITKINDLGDSHIKDAFSTLCNNHADRYPIDHCYTFGWIGSLNHASRKNAAYELYKCLHDLKKKYLQESLSPLFHLITHSHGGNVALCLKKIADEYDNPADLSIEELILLACPVQKETVEYAASSLFKQVYSIHSHNDILQIIDPQGIHAFLETLKVLGLEFTLSNFKRLGPLFSERHFPFGSGIKQLKVRYPHRELFHIEFLLPTFMESLPSLITKMKEQLDAEVDEFVHIFDHTK